MRRLLPVVLALPLFLVLMLSCPSGDADDKPVKRTWPWRIPAGESVRRIEGLSTVLYVPQHMPKDAGASLVIVLHGAGAKAANLATFFRYWTHENYVICAPQAQKRVWTPPDLERVRKIALRVRRALPIDPDKTHVAGFSNGAGNLHAVAFADGIHARSGTWVGMGYRGEPPPLWARSRFGALFMVGGLDRFLGSAKQSVPQLRDKVRSVELIIDPNIGHTWPTSQLAYHLWWTGVQDGRFTPGDDQNFDWDVELDDAIETARERHVGMLVYVYDERTDQASEAGRLLQTHVFMDAEIRRLGRRLAPLKLDRTEAGVLSERLGLVVTETPAVFLLGADLKPKERLVGQIRIEALRRALVRAAPGAVHQRPVR